MAEDEVQYASVVIKNKRRPRAEKQEEVVYDEVKISQTVQQVSDNKDIMLDKEADRRVCQHQKLFLCFGSLCVILVLTIIGVCVYFVFPHKFDDQEVKQLKFNQTILLEEIYNLTKLSSDLKDQVNNLKKEKQMLIAELIQVKTKNHELETQKENLTDQIETMEKTWNEHNVSRAQWSMDQYCPKKDNVRKCKSCENGWEHNQSSCYAVNNAELQKQKTWEEARENCKGKSSDLTVVGDEKEKTFVDSTSWLTDEIKGYWIGLRAEAGKWKWIDESDLTKEAWIQQHPATDGHCVTSLQNTGWSSVSCNDKNAWICEKKALSV